MTESATQTSAMRKWCMALEYDAIREAETVTRRVYKPNGRPVRGVLVTPQWCFGRDRIWYRVDAQKHRATPTAPEIALKRFTLPQLQFLFYIAHRRQRQSHSRSRLAYR